MHATTIEQSSKCRTTRTTFIINEKGIVVDKIDKVDTKQHAQQVLSYAQGE